MAGRQCGGGIIHKRAETGGSMQAVHHVVQAGSAVLVAVIEAAGMQAVDHPLHSAHCPLALSFWEESK